MPTLASTKSGVKSADLDIGLLAELVLCSGQAIGKLPLIYFEKWAGFAEQRMSKEDAMSKFDAEFWMSVQFFDGIQSYAQILPTNMERPKSASKVSAHCNEIDDLVEDRPTGSNPAWASCDKPLNFTTSLHDKPSNSDPTTIPRTGSSFESIPSSGKLQTSNYLTTC
jgi:hypothetical protein